MPKRPKPPTVDGLPADVLQGVQYGPDAAEWLRVVAAKRQADRAAAVERLQAALADVDPVLADLIRLVIE